MIDNKQEHQINDGQSHKQVLTRQYKLQPFQQFYIPYLLVAINNNQNWSGIARAKLAQRNSKLIIQFQFLIQQLDSKSNKKNGLQTQASQINLSVSAKNQLQNQQMQNKNSVESIQAEQVEKVVAIDSNLSKKIKKRHKQKKLAERRRREIATVVPSDDNGGKLAKQVQIIDNQVKKLLMQCKIGVDQVGFRDRLSEKISKALQSQNIENGILQKNTQQ